MSELTLTVLQLGFLVLLWVFVLSVVGVLRRDLFGTKGVPRAGKRRPAARAQGDASTAGPERAPAPARAQPPAAAGPGGGGAPRSLVVTEGAMRGASVDLGAAPVLIGRAPECTLVLSDDYTSGRHARLFPRDGRWFVEDLGSTNGTELGRTKVAQHPVPIEAGQQLRIGRTVLELRR